MKEMIKKIREEKGGFTLAELLIVVAIVLVLVAIAVPVFTGAMEKADKAVGNANIRTVKVQTASTIMLNEDTYDLTKKYEASAKVSESGDLGPVTITEKADAADKATKEKDGTWIITAVVEGDNLTPAKSAA
ncbi:prepilin-type N-terminal cleavage/methylation domain-containing protein [Paraeggerthella hongkongensis]|uniref:prepilin-type N-terminal cleavage/methylation domain-containing protein n=1 Tax=Paraeggerthella hominis TaxID=2897351 RepID=UPI001C0FBAAF|nr:MULTISPECIES: prepilin-type N-terminal cleavage/methylation domain-containing protein [Paraeggerthella]MBU5405554.1 prepilin-type N-terminal cleavage/methylation domain-containing protein [Paraeggerthella hongkongensis]MCD2432627.1 prepilin-type N-terminal cleavage/methylation domain-containing protein [Paraeggerthella hominis]